MKKFYSQYTAEDIKELDIEVILTTVFLKLQQNQVMVDTR
jgi:hypothetical protein